MRILGINAIYSTIRRPGPLSWPTSRPSSSPETLLDGTTLTAQGITYVGTPPCPGPMPDATGTNAV